MHPWHYQEMAFNHDLGRAYLPYGKVPAKEYSIGYDPYRGHMGPPGWNYYAHYAVQPPPYFVNRSEEETEGEEADAETVNESRLSRSSPRKSKSPRGSPRSIRGASALDIKKRVSVQMINVQDGNVSAPVDLIDPIHQCLDPISVSIQERVKFGSHITSVTRKKHAVQAFFFTLKEKGRPVQVTKGHPLC